MYSLYVVGPLLERMWRAWRFLLLYLITGLVGSCCMVVFSAPDFIGAGASGALWGIMASMATWVFLNRAHLPRQLVSAWKRSLLIVFILNVLITYSFRNISASAHFGGGIAGLVVAVPLEYVRYAHGWRRWLAAAGVAAVPLAALALVEQTVGGDRERHQAASELQQVERKYLPKVGWAYRAERKVFDEAVNPLILILPVTLRRLDGRAEKAAAAAGSVQKRMKETADFLAQAGDSFHVREAAEAMQAAKDYVAAARAFYESFGRSLDSEVTWTPEDQATFNRRATELTVRRTRLEELVSLRRPAR
jgi:hypothetical protein